MRLRVIKYLAQNHAPLNQWPHLKQALQNHHSRLILAQH